MGRPGGFARRLVRLLTEYVREDARRQSASGRKRREPPSAAPSPNSSPSTLSSRRGPERARESAAAGPGRRRGSPGPYIPSSLPDLRVRAGATGSASRDHLSSFAGGSEIILFFIFSSLSLYLVSFVYFLIYIIFLRFIPVASFTLPPSPRRAGPIPARSSNEPTGYQAVRTALDGDYKRNSTFPVRENCYRSVYRLGRVCAFGDVTAVGGESTR